MNSLELDVLIRVGLLCL